MLSVERRYDAYDGSAFARSGPPSLSNIIAIGITQPLQEAKDPETGRRYLQCEYNRDASSYRSPWSNKYDPPLEDGFTPGDRLRQMEASAAADASKPRC